MTDYLALQGRYRGLSAAHAAALQADIDAGWERLVARAQPAAGSAQPAAAEARAVAA